MKKISIIFVCLAAMSALAAETKGSANSGKKESTMQAGVWGGYGIQLTNNVDGVSGGGIAFGGDFLMGSGFQYGLGVSYVTLATSSAILPITVQANYFFLPNLYAGVSAGYGIFVGTSVPGTSQTHIPVSAKIGYQMDLDSVLLDLGLQDTLVFSNVSTEVLGTKVSTSSTTMYLTPYVRVAMKF